MFLKFNINDIKHESREVKVSKIEVNEVDERTVYVTFTTDLPHRLAIGDKLRLESAALTAATYTIAEEMAKTNEGALIFVENAAASNKPSYYLVSYGFLNALDDFEVNNLLTYSVSQPDDDIKVIDYNYTDTTFSIEIVTVQKVDVKDVLDGTSTNSVVHLSKPISMFFKRGDTLILKRKIWSYKPIIIDDTSDLRYQVVTDIPTDYNGYDYIKNGNVDDNIFYKWSLHYESIECKFIHGKYIEAPIGVVFPNDEYEILDTRFIKNKVFRSDIKVYELVETLNIALPISSDNNINLDKENLAQHLFKEKREELIPQINDYEKRCFTPYFKNTSDNSIEPISTIKFNLFLRDRSGSDNWTTDDTKGWNQYKFDGDKFTWEVYKTEGDLLGFLNFTDDDVYYRKKNISKSFLRLSFYDSTDPMRQMLLFYSTIFLDGGDLYGKYIKNIEKKIENPEISLVNYNDRISQENNLTLSFKIYDRYNKERCSEGFYLYLFPDGIIDGEGNLQERTIYMKADFNHAGYGMTIPLMRPTRNGKVTSYLNIPTSLIDPNTGDVSKYYDSIYIPVNIRYDVDKDDYIYYFPICERESDKRTLKFDLYEPKVNPIE